MGEKYDILKYYTILKQNNSHQNYHFVFCSGDSVVRVRAQVMMRDDSTGGWVPVGGGGLSNVSVQKQKIFHEDEDQLCKHEYLIDGKRISDQAVSIIIECSYDMLING